MTPDQPGGGVDLILLDVIHQVGGGGILVLDLVEQGQRPHPVAGLEGVEGLSIAPEAVLGGRPGRPLRGEGLEDGLVPGQAEGPDGGDPTESDFGGVQGRAGPRHGRLVEQDRDAEDLGHAFES